MPLRFVDKIEFSTESGTKAVELLYGDITLLSLEEKVDLIMISAVRGAYIPSNTSVIGALKKRFGLEVSRLAEDKEEDFRQQFYCWWSKPLPEKIPYRRLLCFENTRTGASPQQSVKSVFKALVPATSLFSNGVIISPLLSTGDQGYNEITMLTAIITSAVMWMKNGLGISLFKLVIYTGNNYIYEAFQRLKQNFNEVIGTQPNSTSLLPPSPQYDFYLSYVSRDKESVEQVKHIFLKQQKTLTFYASEDRLESEDKSDGGDKKLFDVLKTCSRVITFLSPAYLEDDDRVEEYNAAWCLNRQTTSFTRLAPMLCEGISNLPTYMSLIQWVDIRMQNENKEKPLQNITLYVVTYKQEVLEKSSPGDKKSFLTSTTPTEENLKENVVEEASGTNYDYDVFISYAHANEETCKIIKEVLEGKMPDIKLFIDRQQLHTGGSWQQKLYHAVESSHMTLALLSQSYFNSKMCNEEFRLSLARHFTDSDFHLIPLQIEELTDVDDRYLSVNNCVLGNQDIRSYVEHLLAPVLVNYMATGEADGSILKKDKMTYNLRGSLKQQRSDFLGDMIFKEPEVCAANLPLDKEVIILSSNDLWDSGLAKRIQKRLKRKFGLRVELSLQYTDAAMLLTKLDDSDLIVPLMSSQFLEDPDLVEHLNVAINRQRLEKKTVMYPVLLNTLEGWELHYHIYCELLLYELCLTDFVWISKSLDIVMGDHPNYKELIAECEELQVTHLEMIESLRQRGSGSNDPLRGQLETALRPSHFKCLGTICNRIVYHVSQLESLESMNILVDFSKVINKKKRGVRVKQLKTSSLHNSSFAAELAQVVEAKEKASKELKANDKTEIESKTSTACNLL